MSTSTLPEVTTVTFQTSHGADVTVLAQPTKTPGLVVTPQLGGTRETGPGFTGYWQVTHAPSGKTLPVDHGTGLDIYSAVRVANALSDIDVDWTVGQDQLIEALRDEARRAAVATAIKQGLYPPSDGQWDSERGKPLDGPGSYPNTADQATARQMAASATATALDRYADGWELMNYDRGDDTARRLYFQNLHIMIAEYAFAHVLRAFAAANPEAADAAARDLWEANEAGDGHGEWLSQWGREYGIPTPSQGNAARAGVTLPPALSYEQVMATPLMYPDHGTVGKLRQQLGQYAALHSQRFSEIAAQTANPDDKPDSQEEGERRRREFLMAHSGAMAGWGLVGVLGWLAKEFPQVAVRAARMVDDIGTNGGNDFCQDIHLGDDDGADEIEAVPTA